MSNLLRRRALEGHDSSGNVVYPLMTDTQALQVSFPGEGKSIFGEVSVAQLDPVFQGSFVFGIEPGRFTSLINGSGSITAVNAMAKVNCGATANSHAHLHTRQALHYRAGMGARCRFTALWPSGGVAGSSQYAGIIDVEDGFAFGYQNTTFGIIHRQYGIQETRTLTITTASSTAENITITLDGSATNTVAVTASANKSVTANEIAAHDYKNVGRGWTASAVGNTVVFQSRIAKAGQDGTYSLSGASTAIGSFAQTVDGVTPTETFTPQSSWNGQDKFDGNGLTGVTLNPQKGNVFQINYQYLGFGLISFFVEDPDDGEFHNVHNIEYANAYTRPSVGSPTIPFGVMVTNNTNNTALVVNTASVGMFVDGKVSLDGPRFGATGSRTLANTTETPIITLRNKLVFAGRTNHSQLKILRIACAVEHTKPVTIKFYANAKLTGAVFSNVAATSSVEQDTSASAFSGGIFLFALPLGKTGQEIVYLDKELFDAIAEPGDQFTATMAPSSGNGAEAIVSFNFVEIR